MNIIMWLKRKKCPQPDWLKTKDQTPNEYYIKDLSLWSLKRGFNVSISNTFVTHYIWWFPTFKYYIYFPLIEQIMYLIQSLAVL